MTKISWEELVRNRIPLGPQRNSGLMVAAMQKVQDRYPDAYIEEVERRKTYAVVGGGKRLSGIHASHYDCWIEAAERL